MKELIRTAIPLGMSEFLASGEWHIVTLYAAYIGDVAAWTVAGAIWEFFEQSPEGIGTAAIIRIGYHLGQANPRKAKIAAYKSLLACLVWSATLTTIFMCQSNAIIALFTNDDYIASILEGAVVLIGAGNCAMCIGNLAWTILSAQSRPKIAAWEYGGVGVAREHECLDPCGTEATDDIIDGLVGNQVDKIGALLSRALKNKRCDLGSADSPNSILTNIQRREYPSLPIHEQLLLSKMKIQHTSPIDSRKYSDSMFTMSFSSSHPASAQVAS